MLARAVTSVMVVLLSVSSASMQITLTPINGTNDLLREEVPFGVVEVDNLTPVEVGAAGSTLSFEVRRAGGNWERCRGPQPPIDVQDRPRSPFGVPIRPGERRAMYLGALDGTCRNLTGADGTFEMRAVFESKQTGVVTSPPQLVTVREPTGVDAAALDYKTKLGRRFSRGEFLVKFPGSRYVAPYLPAGRPDRPTQPIAERARSLRVSPTAAELDGRQSSIGAFLERNPRHLFADALLREYVAIASARGDMAALESGVRAMESRHPGSTEAAEARELLQSQR